MLAGILSFTATSTTTGEGDDVDDGEMRSNQIRGYRAESIVYATLVLLPLILAIHNLARFICKAGQVWSLYVFYFLVVTHLSVAFANYVSAAIFTPTRFTNLCDPELPTMTILFRILVDQSYLATYFLITIMIYLVKENLKLYNIPLEKQKFAPQQIKSNMKWVYFSAITIWVVLGTIRTVIMFSTLSSRTKYLWIFSIALVEQIILLITFLMVMR